MAEQRTFNPLVQGSTPWRPTRPELVCYLIQGIELAALAEQLRAAGIDRQQQGPQEPEPHPPGGRAGITGRKKCAAYVS